MPRPSIGERVYRRMLRIYPREFADDYADEMTGLYRDCVREEGAARVWLALLADLAHTAPQQQFAALAQDLRHAWRTWRRTPVLAAAAILTLTLGVGANVAVFSVVHGVLLRPLPYPQPERLVELFEDNRRTNAPFFRVSLLNYLSWVERARSFDAIAAFLGTDLTVTEGGDPERLAGSEITASLFDVLGVAPIAGRPFGRDDEQPGAAPVALIAESLWRRRFGGDPHVLDRSIVLSGTPHRIVGIVPSGFREVGRAQIGLAGAAQIFVPMTMNTRQSRGNHVLRVVARLRQDISVQQARNDLQTIAAGMEDEFPETNRGWSASVVPLQDSMLDRPVRLSLLVLLGAVGVVLLIVCANVANLLLARAVARQREIALRTVLGASPVRLARQLLTESVALAIVSGACGLAAAWFSMRTLVTFIPPGVPRVDEIGLDATVLGFSLGVSLACGLFFGAVPAVRASRVTGLAGLTQSGKAILGSSRAALRHGLVVAQLSLATMLLVVAALLLQSFVRLQDVSLGFDPQDVLTVRLSLPRVNYPDAARTHAFERTVLQSIEALPNIRAVGLMTSAPFAPGVRRSVSLRDRASVNASPDSGISAVEQVVSADVFRALGTRLVSGRPFGAQDYTGSRLVAIVSDRLARRLWSDGQAIGRVLEFDGLAHEVIGVVGDMRGNDGAGLRGGGRDREPPPVIYRSAAQFPQNTVALVVRTDDEVSAVLPAIRTTIGALDPDLPLQDVRRLEEWIAESAAQPRLTASVAGTFAVVALLLATIGIYGVVSYSVGQRTQEIGLRMAMGAARTSVLGLVLREGATWAGAGIALGLLGAWAISRALAGLLFEVSARDPITFVGTACGLSAIAMLACALPALRATRIDPIIALRGD